MIFVGKKKKTRLHQKVLHKKYILKNKFTMPLIKLKLLLCIKYVSAFYVRHRMLIDNREGEQIVREKRKNQIDQKRKKKNHTTTSTTYSHLTIKLHTILYTLYSFLHFKQTLNAKSFQYDANTSKRETHRARI